MSSVFLAQICTQAGWFTAEMGRQPWVVYEVLKTGEAVSAVVKAPQVLTSIILFTLIYIFLTFLFLSLLKHKIAKGPEHVEAVKNLPEKWQPLSLKGEDELKG